MVLTIKVTNVGASQKIREAVEFMDRVAVKAPTILLSTTGSEELGKDIYSSLKSRMGITMGKTIVNYFSNGNVDVQIPSIRANNVVIVHTQVPPVNDNLMELFGLLQAVRNSSPGKVHLVFPYMPYSRSDVKDKHGLSTLGMFIPRVITTLLLRDIDKVLLLDPHSTQTKQYFDPFSEEITALYLLADHMLRGFISEHGKDNCVLVYADAGSANRYKKLRHLLGIPGAYIDKSRPGDDERPEVGAVVGDVSRKHCLLVDDEVLTARTAKTDAEALFDSGAQSVCLYAVHPILDDRKNGPEHVIKSITDSPINKVVVTDSIPVRDKVRGNDKFEIVSVVPLLAETIKRIIEGGSISELYSLEAVPLYKG